MAIKNIVFDMGGVLLTKAEKKDVKNALTFKEDTDVVFSSLFHAPVRVELDRGTISEQDAFNVIYESIPARSRADAKNFYDHYMTHRTPSFGMIDLLENLKKNGYNLYVLSNFYTDMREYLQKNGLDFLKHFSEIYNSSEHKLVKPNKEIYLDFLSLYGLNANECFFIDDKEKNVLSAKECGFFGATFINSEDLKGELRKNGVKT